MNTEPTKGEQIVRATFNPSKNSEVDQFKQAIAANINFIEEHKAKDPRLAAIAQTKLEEAAMFGVKLLTT